MLTDPFRPVPFLLAAACLLPPSHAATTAPARSAAIDPETVVELRALLSDGRCEEVLARLAALPKDPPQPDLLAMEGNCRLRGATSRQSVFDPQRYERAKIGAGDFPLDPAATQQFYRRETSFDEPARDAALALFIRAHELAPERTDIVVGTLAAHLDGGRTAAAVDFLRANASRLDEGAMAELYHVVQDQLRLGRTEDAGALVAAMLEIAPASHAANAAAGSVALERRDLAAAAAAFGRATDAGSLTVDQAHELARLRMLNRDWEGAVRTLIPVAASSPELKVWLALSRGRLSPRSSVPIWQELKRTLLQSESSDPRAAAMVDYFLTSAQADPLPSPVSRVRAARRLLDLRAQLAALAEADRAVLEDPSLVAGWKTMTDVYRSLGYPELALATIEKAQAVVAKEADQAGYAPGELERERAELLFAAGRDEEALAAFERAAGLGEPAPYAWGLAALAAGRRDEAIVRFKAAAAGEGTVADAAKAKLKELGLAP